MEKKRIKIDTTSARCILKGLLKNGDTPTMLNFAEQFSTDPALLGVSLEATLLFHIQKGNHDSALEILHQFKKNGIQLSVDLIQQMFDEITLHSVDLLATIILLKLNLGELAVPSLQKAICEHYTNVKGLKGRFFLRDRMVLLFFLQNSPDHRPLREEFYTLLATPYITLTSTAITDTEPFFTLLADAQAYQKPESTTTDSDENPEETQHLEAKKQQ